MAACCAELWRFYTPPHRHGTSSAPLALPCSIPSRSRAPKLPAIASPSRPWICPKARVATESPISLFQLPPAQSRFFHHLPSGSKMEIIHQTANHEMGRAQMPPIVFLHGSFHAAWCWAVHWLPFFAAQGHDCFALSLLGQGESDLPPQEAPGTLQSHARDVAHFIRHAVPAPPILLGHSFGGLIVQQYLAYVAEPNSKQLPASTAEGWEEPYPILAAAILACSVPPTGNGPLVKRYLMSKPIASIKVTLSFAARAFAYNLSLCQETFFSRNMPTSLVQRYQRFLARSSTVPLFNLRELSASLPVTQPAVHAPPILVIGAENDFVVDLEGLKETAAFYGTSPVVLPCIAHDIMLDTAWENAAEAVGSWIKETGL